MDGVTLTGIGYVDGWLHVQVYYADILKKNKTETTALTVPVVKLGDWRANVFTGLRPTPAGMVQDVRHPLLGLTRRDVPLEDHRRQLRVPGVPRPVFFFILLLFRIPIAAKIRR